MLASPPINVDILATSAFKSLISAVAASKSPTFALFAYKSSILALAAVRSVILALLDIRVCILAFSASKSLTLALTAFNSFISAFPTNKLLIAALFASKSLVLTLSAITISNSVICEPISSRFPCILATVFLPAAGFVRFPVTVALWSFIITVTLSPLFNSVVVSTGVIKSEPSICTYI